MSVRGDILLFKLLSHYELVVEHGQLKSAAEELGLKQSNLSKEMKLLEEMVGTELLTRTSHGVRLTLTGEQVFAQAKDCISRVADLTNRFHGETQNASITMQATSATLMSFHKYLDLFKQIYPSVTCNFYDGQVSNPSILKNVDVCATYMQNKWPNADVICEGKIVFNLMTTQKYLDIYGYPENLEDLHQNHHLCLCEEYSRYNPQYDDIMTNCRHVDFQVSNFDMMLSMLRQKCLIAKMPAYMNRIFPDLVKIEVPGWQLKMPIQIITASGRSKIPYVHTMCSFLIELYREIMMAGGIEDLIIYPSYTKNKNLIQLKLEK